MWKILEWEQWFLQLISDAVFLTHLKAFLKLGLLNKMLFILIDFFVVLYLFKKKLKKNGGIHVEILPSLTFTNPLYSKGLGSHAAAICFLKVV